MPLLSLINLYKVKCNQAVNNTYSNCDFTAFRLVIHLHLKALTNEVLCLLETPIIIITFALGICVESGCNKINVYTLHVGNHGTCFYKRVLFDYLCFH